MHRGYWWVHIRRMCSMSNGLGKERHHKNVACVHTERIAHTQTSLAGHAQSVHQQVVDYGKIAIFVFSCGEFRADVGEKA